MRILGRDIPLNSNPSFIKYCVLASVFYWHTNRFGLVGLQATTSHAIAPLNNAKIINNDPLGFSLADWRMITFFGGQFWRYADSRQLFLMLTRDYNG